MEFRISTSSEHVSPSAKTPSSDSKRKSVASDMLRKSVLKDRAKRLSGLVSPFVSQLARRSLQGTDRSAASPVATSLFTDMETNEPVTKDTNNEPETAPLVDIFDPVVPLSSPVTKTYGKKSFSPAAKQRQIDAFDQMVVGGSSPSESCFLSEDTKIPNNEDVELINFDSPLMDTVAQNSVTSIKKSRKSIKINPTPAKTPSRRSMRLVPK